MSSKRPQAANLELDPGCYLGQSELRLDGKEAGQTDGQQKGEKLDEQQQEQRLGKMGSEEQLSGPSVPTVLTKLQKWGDYESVGDQVLPTKFIPMKTPLSSHILDSWSLPRQPKHRLTVPEMVGEQAALGRKVGLLLDLSNHDCLYTADIPAGMHYLHIQLVAKELPPPEFVDTVVAAANRFWSAHPEEYIAVHCAYGFNRTGFVVCCYLIECCGLSVEGALEAFAESRPPGVKHVQFRNELYRRYGYIAACGVGQFGSAVCGSPDDNSSIYSPSCASLDLRDLGPGGGGGSGSGPSSVPRLTRGVTYDCLPGGPYTPGTSSSSFSPPPGVAATRRSFDGHQTLTFTSTSSMNTEVRGGHGVCARAASWQHRTIWQQQQPPPPLRPLILRPLMQSDTDEQSEQSEREAAVGSSEEEATGGVRGPAGRSGGKSVLMGEVLHSTTTVLGYGGRRSSSEEVEKATDSACRQQQQQHQQQPQEQAQSQQQSCSNENESLGVNDRLILQTMRQHALAQASSTIPEEGASDHSTPVGGRSYASLVDCDNMTGNSTPRMSIYGKNSYKGLETIDWAAAAPGVTAGGDCAGPPVDGLKNLRTVD